MNRFARGISYGLTVAVLLGSGTASWAAKSSDMAAVHAADASWAKAYNAGRLDDVVGVYDENAIVYAWDSDKMPAPSTPGEK